MNYIVINLYLHMKVPIQKVLLEGLAKNKIL